MPKKIAFIGLQTGDEGKGKISQEIGFLASQKVGIVPDFTPRPVLIERPDGGPNAGHTLVIEGKTYKLHQAPCGFSMSNVYNLLGENMYINPRKLMQEIKVLQSAGYPLHSWNLGISANAHIIMDHHVQEDLGAFRQKNHTSTGNGMKQAAVDKHGRVGMRFVEFLDRELMIDCLRKRFPKGMVRNNYYGFSDSYAPEREFLSQFVTQSHVARTTHGTEYWIGEGANGFLLDVNAGQYPGITSSNIANVPNGTDTIFGVVKLYCSSVGTGDRAFMSRMEWGLEEILREKWGEFGSTTGRKREVGWFDAVAVKYAVESTKTDYLAGTCGDRLEELYKMNEPLKMVTGYKIGRKIYREWDVSFHRRDTLKQVEPIFEEFETWERFTHADGKTLTDPAQRYIDRIQELTGKEFVMLGTGPARNDVIMYKDVLEL
ncbi:MAG: adenylosuccinate synthetase [Nanoarchaeota archaeon]|nr:adenylosuccinate synthetase [Nanoarchaeota archaeon]